jgi:hypothetical protein
MFCNSKNHIFFTVLFWLVLWLCISKMIVELERARIEHFKSLKPKKNWERSAQMFGQKQVIHDGQFYPILLITIPFYKFILISRECIFWWFFFAMDHLVGISPKTLYNPSLPNKNHIFYIVLHLHCFRQHKINSHNFALARSVSLKPFTHTTLYHTQ